MIVHLCTVIVSEAADRLHCLTTRDGDWFLDELGSITDNLLEYVSMTQPDHPSKSDYDGQLEDKTNTAFLYSTLTGVQKVYLSLQVCC